MGARGYVDIGRRLPSSIERWQGEEFASELSDWVAGEVGPVRVLEHVKLRVWASVWAVETDDRRFFAKQNCELQAFEAELVATLAGLVPDRVVPVEAVDPERGLLLTPDQGQVLGEGSAPDDLDVWERVLVAGAELQRDLVPHVDRLREVGLTTLAPEDSVGYVEARIDDLSSLPDADPRALTGEETASLASALPSVGAWADEVGALGLPVTLNHNDLHENNVFAVGETLRFFDYADSLLSEPLGVLLIPLNMLSNRLEAGPDDPRLWRLADAALEVWSDRVPLAQLRAALPAALQLARLGRAESWARCCASMSDEELAEWGNTVPRWLSTLLLDPPVGHVRR
jgi:hypothetical protein